MEKKIKGTLNGHLCRMLSKLYLWTSQAKVTNFFQLIKNGSCFSCDSVAAKIIEDADSLKRYEVLLDFGDFQTTITMVFKLSAATKRWVLCEIY